MTCSRFLQLPKSGVLSVFFTAGYPRLNDTRLILDALQEAGVDMVEVGFPFSDPVADGPTIQESNSVALRNGMTVRTLMSQLHGFRSKGVTMPVLLMGYLNPVERYGAERFFREAAECGADALIIPDMPFDGYEERYRALFRKYGLQPVFLVTSRTGPDRVRAFDAEQPAFLYVLSSDAVTGGSATVTGEREEFFGRLSDMGLQSPLIVGFGVSDRASFQAVTKRTSGAIVGSAFLRAIAQVPAGPDGTQSDGAALREAVSEFVLGVR